MGSYFPSTLSITKLRKRLLDFHAKNGRHELPWRTTFDPYHVLVSEIMLQQTQVPRVIPKFNEWIKKFPTLEDLAQASNHAVLSCWNGLGYNRRGLNLLKAAREAVAAHGGKLSRTIEGLERLPGIGPYTARAILAFAHDISYPFIETNIRFVLMYELFPDAVKEITDNQLLPIVKKLIEKISARTIYMALMDYGSHLKATLEKKETTSLHKKHKHYVRQSAFKGSKRQLRAAILKELLKGPATARKLSKLGKNSTHSSEQCIAELLREGLIHQAKDKKFAV